MKFREQDDPTLKNGFFEFLFWYRFATLSIVVLFALFHVREISAPIIIFALAYNSFLRVFRTRLRAATRNYPVLILFDAAISFALIATTGGYKSPFQLYTLSPVISGAYLLGYRGALATASVQCCLYYIAFTINGFRVDMIMRNGEQLISTYLEYFVVGLSISYISELIKILSETTGKKNTLEQDLNESLGYLQSSPDFAELSKRELQVLCLILDGKTIEQAANVLSISKDSAKTYLSRIYKKTGVSSRCEAICKVFERGPASDRIET